MNITTDIHPLSKREKDCARYLIQGMTYQEIAEILFISCRTVESHVKHMKEKLSCKKRSQLILKLLKNEYKLL